MTDTTWAERCAQPERLIFGSFTIDDVEAAANEFAFQEHPVFLAEHPAPVGGWKALVRGSTGQVLHVHRRTYGAHQYTDTVLAAVASMHEITESNMGISAIAWRRNGARFYVQVDLGEPLDILGDLITPSVFIADSVDGSTMAQARVGAFRFACFNQLNAMRREVTLFKMRHTSKSSTTLDISAAIEAAFGMRDTFADEVSKLIETTVTDAEFRRLIESAFPITDATSAAAATRQEGRRDAMWSTWTSDQRVATLRGTAWGAVQAFNTTRSHRPVRSGDSGARMIERVVSGVSGRSDQKILDMLEAVR